MNIQLERSLIYVYGLPLLIILTSVLLALSPLLYKHADLAMGITYDLTLTAPLVYLFLIRKKKIPFISVAPFFLLGILLASFLIPEHQQDHLGLVITYLLPAVELTIFSVVLYHVYRTVKTFRANSNDTSDFYLILKESAVKALGYPRIAKVIATEVAMLYYTFFTWKKKQEQEHHFTSFKDNGTTALLAIIVFILLIETFVVHLVVARWNETIAWVLTLSSIYMAIQIFGHMKALRQRSTALVGNSLFIKHGLLGDLKVTTNRILKVEQTSHNIKIEAGKVEKLALLKDMESHNVAIYFTQKQQIERAYGFTKECDILLLHIDNSDDFVTAVNNALIHEH